jgi:hypothetical protein
MAEMSEIDWHEFELKLQKYADAITDNWRDPQFHLSGGIDDEQPLTFRTKNDGTARSMKSGDLVRGSSDVEVRVWYDEPRPSLREAIHPFRLPSLGIPSTNSEENVKAAREELTKVVTKYPDMARRIGRLVWGPLANRGSEEDRSMFSSTRATVDAIDVLLSECLSKKGWSISDLRQITLTTDDVQELVKQLRALTVAKFEGYRLIAMLNGPPIDAREPSLIWQGEWYDQPCFVEVGYPTDELCARVFKERFGSGRVPKPLTNVNCYVAFWYLVPVDLDPSELIPVHTTARDYVRAAIDLLRVSTPCDVGVLYYHGDVVTHEVSSLSSFMGVFDDHQASLLRTPVRRIYDVPLVENALSAESLEEVGQLFSKFAVERIQIPGLAVAMERLRIAYERYAPDEMGRLVDAITALEALFLSDGSTNELKFRLQVRIARLLSTNSQERYTLAETISKIYDLRSGLVHTGQISKTLRGRSAELQMEALAILRRSILHLLRTDFATGKSPSAMKAEWLKLVLS